MPELPEAETIARQLHASLAGKTLGRVSHLRPDIVRGPDQAAPSWLEGSRVLEVGRRGKRVIVNLSDRRGIIFFLGMTGKLFVQPRETPAPKHTHLRIGIRGSRRELRFVDSRRFGGVAFFALSNGNLPPGIGELPPRNLELPPGIGEPPPGIVELPPGNGGPPPGNCGPPPGDVELPPGIVELGVEPLDMTAARFRRLMARDRQIKALLLDQRVIAGLGNIYCDEALHRAGIHPLELASQVDPARIGRLCRAIKSVLRAAIRAEGSSFSNFLHLNGPGSYQRRHLVYGHEGDPCRTCRTILIRIQAAGRSSHLCPSCQPLGKGVRNQIGFS